MRNIFTAVLLCAAVAPALAEGTHVVEKGDTLWSLYGRYCGQPAQWEHLYKANAGQIKDPHWIYPDTTLVLPDCQGAKAAEAQPLSPVAAEPEPAPAPAGPAVGADEQPAAQASSQVVEAPAGGAAQADDGYIVIEKQKLELSEEMPQDMAWGLPSADSEVLPAGWEPDGKVRFASAKDKYDDFAGQGDVIELKLSRECEVKVGDYFKVYRLGVEVNDEHGKPGGVRAQQSALLKVRSVDGKYVSAEIVRLENPVEKGDPVKKL